MNCLLMTYFIKGDLPRQMQFTNKSLRKTFGLGAGWNARRQFVVYWESLIWIINLIKSMQSQKMPKKKQVKKFLLYYLVIIRISQFLSAEKHKHVKMIFAIWLSLFSWTKIEFNKEKRHLIGDHIFAEENIYWSINSKQETLVPKTFSFELKKPK